MKIRKILSKFDSTLSKINPVHMVLDRVAEYAFEIKCIPLVSKFFDYYYICHPKKENVLIEPKDYVRCVFEEQVDAIINYCSNNANIKYISIERVRDVNINADGNGYDSLITIKRQPDSANSCLCSTNGAGLCSDYCTYIRFGKMDNIQYC
ncbi:hypothetical protein GC093_29960 [Paenibacillus sp. LMG 31456]|uniref:Uncharacterized protein n=1 Tax=Paenibacillus foliorum TaxID=2654974 RepID=A0A972GW65_9BACL|nr:hypothetical protein [Paenibacillus foliorum]NOU97423.1 hypothetical protein [Paenibacillus foliorum]